MRWTDWFCSSSLFSLKQPVGGLQYLTVGITLAVFKYLVEAAVIAWTTEQFYSPWDFVNPFLSGKEEFLDVGPSWLGTVWFLWTLPFVWICLQMSVRRCADAAASPWISFIAFVPIINLVGLPFLAAMPSQREESSATTSETAEAIVKNAADTATTTQRGSGWEAALLGLFVGIGYLVLSVMVCVLMVGSYGTALFFGAPVLRRCKTISYRTAIDSG
jgi:uncharacterized membrane protein YhaH (DUF805 family)